jgi:elongation factor Tu
MESNHLIIGTIGHTNHGKTTLAAAITKVLSLNGQAAFVPYEQIRKGSRGNINGITISTSQIVYKVERNQYTQVDFPSHEDYVKSMISGSLHMNGVILVVSAVEGIMPQTRDQIVLAYQAKVPYVVVYLNKIDQVDNSEQLDLLEMELYDLFRRIGYPVDLIWMIRGSALRILECTSNDPDCLEYQSIHKLLEKIEINFHPFLPLTLLPFLMPIDGAYFNAEYGTIVTGRVERGQIDLGKTVAIIGYGDTRKTEVEAIEMSRKYIDRAKAGDSVSVLLKGLSPQDAGRGQVLALPNSIHPHSKVKAHVYIFSPEEGGRRTPIMSNSSFQMGFYHFDFTGVIFICDGIYLIMPGEDKHVNIEFSAPIALEEGMHFSICEGGKVIGLGLVVEVQ